MSPDEDHVCVSHSAVCNGDYWDCINKIVYGPCEHELCGGVCTPYEDCTCDCHKEG